jgi:hypothetical protein
MAITNNKNNVILIRRKGRKFHAVRCDFINQTHDDAGNLDMKNIIDAGKTSFM